MKTQTEHLTKVRGNCCYCGRDTSTLVNHSTKSGITKQSGEQDVEVEEVKATEKIGFPTPILYKTSGNNAVCERCVATHTFAISLGGKPVLGYDLVGGYYVVHPTYKKLNFEMVDMDEGSHF